MKIAFSVVSLLLIAFAKFCSAAVEGAGWLSSSTLEVRAQTPQEEIKERNFFEVSFSKFDDARRRLDSVPFSTVGNAAIDFFGQRNFRCEEGRQAYLVRAIYANGSTGKYYVRRYGSSLLITHASLGEASAVKQSALVVCLDFEPTAVYGEINGAL
ncbi:hypothetical protein [Tahibacter caeni]|uniref:hypothetical protein n=1 Tax=Tahibacter caeni TaxID=1453545 RepID=UPI002149218D|nr:hypothetical protein [Tahibacter caeni]